MLAVAQFTALRGAALGDGIDHLEGGIAVGGDGPASDSTRGGSAVTTPAPVDRSSEGVGTSTEQGLPSEVAGLSDALADFADVQQELLAIGADASDQVAAFDEHRVGERDRTRTAALALYGGAAAVVLGSLLLRVTRPRWPATR